RLSSNGWYWNRIVYEKLTEYTKRVNAILWNVDSRVVDGMPNGSAFVTRILSLVSSFFDKNVIDLFFNMVGWLTRAVSVFVRYFQTGLLNNYLLVMVLGLFLIIVGLEGKAITDLFQKVSNLVQFRK
ncbi:MAG: hypothetical protein JNN15_12130, partial [Blastocatellia bacterium]|nr:hypothetical protein [Blastocatellia bacterium]